MQANLVHIFINVSDSENCFSFYKTILGYLGYKIEFEGEEQIGFNNGNTEIWLRPAKIGQISDFDRNNVGLNHIAFRVSTRHDVDKFVEDILIPNNIQPLYGSPRIFPDFTDDYYAVYFEDLDGIKLELTSYIFEFDG